jgi:hypothetical protein
MCALFAILLFLSPASPQEHQSKPDQKKDNAQTVSSPSPTPSPCGTVTCQVSQAGSNAGAQQPKEQSKNIWEKAFAPELWSQWGVLLVAVIAAWIYWHTLKGTHRAADAAETSAKAAEKNTNALIASERPWIVVTLRKGVKDRIESDRSQQGKTLQGTNIRYFEWFLTNHGKTPALVYEIFAFIEYMSPEQFIALGQKGLPEDAKPLRPDAFIVGPNTTHECPGVKMYWKVEERLPNETLLVAHGIVKYRDVIVGDAHETPFLSYYVFAENFYEGEFRRVYDAAAYNKYT